MHMYVWTRQPFFFAVAQAPTAEKAREKMLLEIGDPDGSCPERREAHEFVKNNTPSIWHGTNAEFALTDSAERIEMGLEIERLAKELQALRRELDRESPTA